MYEPATLAAVLLAGALIGATGIGGVLVVPALAQFEGLGWPQAIAVSAVAFALPGVAALWWLWRSGASHPGLPMLIAAALPGAMAGAALVHGVNPAWLAAVLCLLALASGARGLWQLRPRAPAGAPATHAALPPLALGMLGAAVGFGSAITGTGGPVLLVPVLLLLRQPLTLSIAGAQAIQLPVALSAGAAHWASGALPVRDALVLGLLLVAGSFAGQRVARGWSAAGLQRAVSLLLLAVGIWYAWRLASPLWT